MLPKARCPASGRAEGSRHPLRGKRGDSTDRHKNQKRTLDHVSYGENTSDFWTGARKRLCWR